MLFDKKGKKKLFYLCKQEQTRKQKKTKKIWWKFLFQMQDHEYRVNTTIYFVEHVNQVLNSWKHYLNKFLDQSQLWLH